ncbi:MAG: hypothetical protein F6K54_09145 [Okeania sp. SIO3B5]|uniref:hypothetical protein n=1 Tax=Okeania sp. SIO3B5 TaxID=2607811 RepID=UPI0014003E84|nr:hypothetical protein [Okeania sp. SIO3B5]NEO53228.1 hypothetical protein [Okeania sp. SIO3B5]
MSRLPALSQFNFGCFDGWESRAALVEQRREDVKEALKKKLATRKDLDALSIINN